MSPDRSLAEILANRMRAGEAIPVPLALAIVRQLCDALDYAHGLRDATGNWLGVVHRDVSPKNIWVSAAGTVTLVASASPNGTFAYMAPEYVVTGNLDWRADLFGLGVVAYEMLTNRPLFAAPTDRETLDRVCMLEVAPPSTLNPYVPPEIDGIVLTALARDPAYRWQYAAMMRDNLNAVARHYGLDAAAGDRALWSDLVSARLDPIGSPPEIATSTPDPAPAVAATAEPPPAPAPPPGDQWTDETNQETRVQPFDPALLEGLPMPESASPSPPPAAPAPLRPIPTADAAARPARTPRSTKTPAPMLMKPEVAPFRSSAPPGSAAAAAAAALEAELARAALAAAGNAPSPPATEAELAQVSFSAPAAKLAAKPAPASAPVVAAPGAPGRAESGPLVDSELGPEPTQIGAMPLISFGDTPLVSKVGETPRPPVRPSGTTLPPPVGTFLRAETEPGLGPKKRLAILIGIVVAVVLVIVIVLAVR